MLVYGRDSLTLEEVQTTLMAKELKKKSDGNEEGNGDNLFARGRSEKREEKPRGQQRSKSTFKRKCFH